METVGGGVRTHVLQLLKNLDPERYELTLIYGERYDHVFESQREELAKHVTLILDSNLVRSAGLRASWKAVKSLRATLRRIKPDIVHCHSSIAVPPPNWSMCRKSFIPRMLMRLTRRSSLRRRERCLDWLSA